MQHIPALVTRQRQVNSLFLVAECGATDIIDIIVVNLGTVEYTLTLIREEVTILNSSGEYCEVTSTAGTDTNSVAHCLAWEPFAYTDTGARRYETIEYHHIALSIIHHHIIRRRSTRQHQIGLLPIHHFGCIKLVTHHRPVNCLVLPPTNRAPRIMNGRIDKPVARDIDRCCGIGLRQNDRASIHIDGAVERTQGIISRVSGVVTTIGV